MGVSEMECKVFGIEFDDVTTDRVDDVTDWLGLGVIDRSGLETDTLSS